MAATSGICWICGNFGRLTGEHRVKKANVIALYGRTWRKPIYFNSATMRNVMVQGPDSTHLKALGPCAACNGRLTQPYDRAWDDLFAFIRKGKLRPGDTVDPTSIWGPNAVQKMLGVHLYLVKQLGTAIREHEVDIDLQPFAHALLKTVPAPCLHIRFGAGAMFAGAPFTGGSDLELLSERATGLTALAQWGLFVGGFGANLMVARQGAWWQGLIGSWHPSQGSRPFVLADFGKPLPSLPR